MTLRVSVVVPAYNRATLLPRALESIAAQSRPPDEVLVVDDGSDDGTSELMARRFPWARSLRQVHRGVSAARNLGIRAATGDWVAFLDSDDAWLPSKLERQLGALAASPEHRICHTDELWIRDGRRVNPRRRHRKSGGRIFRRCLELCLISPSSVLLEQGLLEDVGLFDESLPACEDYDLWLRICASHPVLYVDEPLVIKYGGHTDQLTRRIWGLDRFRIAALERILDSAVLAAEDRGATRRALLKKIDIYLKGAEKRGKLDEVRHYRRKRARLLARDVEPATRDSRP